MALFLLPSSLVITLVDDEAVELLLADGFGGGA